MTLEEKLNEIINRPDAGRGGEEIVAEILEAVSDWADEVIDTPVVDANGNIIEENDFYEEQYLRKLQHERKNQTLNQQ